MDCYSCLSISGEKRISPGQYIYEGQYWLVDHANPTTQRGWLVIVLKRHAEALHELSREEFAELAEIQYRLARVMQQDAQTLKEYMMQFAEAEHFSHVHIHFVPRPVDLPHELRGPRVFAQLNVPVEKALPPEEIITISEQLRERFLAVE